MIPSPECLNAHFVVFEVESTSGDFSKKIHTILMLFPGNIYFSLSPLLTTAAHILLCLLNPSHSHYRHSLTCVAWLADALVVTGFLNAVKGVAWMAGIGLTFIYISLTTLACKARWAVAMVTTHSVHTCSIVQAFGDTAIRIRGTIILIYFTQDTYRDKQQTIIPKVLILHTPNMSPLLELLVKGKVTSCSTSCWKKSSSEVDLFQMSSYSLSSDSRKKST